MKRGAVVFLIVALLLGVYPTPTVNAQQSEPCGKVYRSYLPLVGQNMIIARFGATWDTAYQFGILKGADDYQTQRLGSTGQVGGMSGVYDFWGSGANPISAQAVSKKFEITSAGSTFTCPGTVSLGVASTTVTGVSTEFLSDVAAGDTITFSDGFASVVASVTDDTHLITVDTTSLDHTGVTYTITRAASHYQDMDTVLDTLKLATINAGESKLWALRRDGAKVWSWAKCNRLRAPEEYNTKLHIPVELEFLCREGVWYSETEQTFTVSGGAPTPYTFDVTNAGTMPAYVKATLIGYVNNITTPKLENLTNGYEWTFDRAGTTSDVAIGKTLVVDAAQSSVVYDGAGAYASLSIGAAQQNWMRLEPGVNSMRLTTAGSTNRQCTLAWYSTYTA